MARDGGAVPVPVGSLVAEHDTGVSEPFPLVAAPVDVRPLALGRVVGADVHKDDPAGRAAKAGGQSGEDGHCADAPVPCDP